MQSTVMNHELHFPVGSEYSILYIDIIVQKAAYSL